MKIQPKNWLEFQHYKDRSPIWIKLHRKLLDDYEYHCLPLASKAIAPFLWLLASEYQDGIIDANNDKIAFRLRVTVKELQTAIEPLIKSGFFNSYQEDSNTLADGYQDACLEKRREEKEKSKIFPLTDDFEKLFVWFWKSYALSEGRGKSGDKQKTRTRMAKTILSQDDAYRFAFAVNEYFRQVDEQNAESKNGWQRPLKLPEVFANEWQGFIPDDAEERLKRQKEVKADAEKDV